MRLSHVFLAILLAAIWGFNFIAIHFGLKQMSPQMLCLARVIGTCFPLVFFIKKPDAPFKTIALYGMAMFVLQYTFLFYGMKAGMTPGLSSILMQTQVFFTLFLAFPFFDEVPNKWQIIGALISFLGIALIGANLDMDVSLSGFVFVLAAALSWSVGSLIPKKTGKINMLSLVTWGSLIAWPPLLLITFFTDGSNTLIHSLQSLTWTSIAAIFYITYPSTLIALVIWHWLLAKYPTAVVVPFSLLVPFFGMVSSALFLNEPLQTWKLVAAALVIMGLCINIFAPRLMLTMHRIRATG